MKLGQYFHTQNQSLSTEIQSIYRFEVRLIKHYCQQHPHIGQIRVSSSTSGEISRRPRATRLANRLRSIGFPPSNRLPQIHALATLGIGTCSGTQLSGTTKRTL